METGRVINRRYLLKRLMKQGQIATIYQGVDQVLQRTVAVKAVPAAHISAYRAAVRLTAQFSHPNIIGLYDLVLQPETLYLVQEFVEGEDFSALLQRQLSPHEVADMGCQISQTLLYAGTPSRKLCHGDLTPTAILRDSQGLVRINNFALPSDLYYFTSWSSVGSEGITVSDRDLPWGQQSEGRQADDTRAVGLLLYQLLAGRPPGTTKIDPPVDRQLRFPRTVPAELCNIVARLLIRQHPQHISNAETLYTELKLLAEALEPAVPVLVSSIRENEEVVKPRQIPPLGTGKLVSALPVRESGQPGKGLAAYSGKMAALEAAPAAPTVADVPLPPSATHQRGHSEPEIPSEEHHSPILVLLLIGLIVFVLFFAVGYFAGHFFIGQ